MGLKHQLTKSDYLDYSEYDRFIKVLDKDKQYVWEAYAVVSFCTALRASDVLQLKWEHILNQSIVCVTEKKTGKTRRIQMNQSVQNKIADLYKKMGYPEITGYIFANKKDGKPFTIQYVNRQLKWFKDWYHLNIVNFSTHTFRKTFGRYVYETKGRTSEALVLLNEIFNHTSIQITKTYIGLTQSEINEVFESIKL